VKRLSEASILDVVRDLLRDEEHSRSSVVAEHGISFPTADRWLEQIRTTLPGVSKRKVGKVTWYGWSPPRRRGGRR
jgi:hypothetical protein